MESISTSLSLHPTKVTRASRKKILFVNNTVIEKRRNQSNLFEIYLAEIHRSVINSFSDIL